MKGTTKIKICLYVIIGELIWNSTEVVIAIKDKNTLYALLSSIPLVICIIVLVMLLNIYSHACRKEVIEGISHVARKYKEQDNEND